MNPPGFIPASLGDDDNCMSTCMSVIEKIVIGWYSCLPVNSVIYGLPYRLGLLDFSSTDFNLYSTILSITSTVNYNFLMQKKEYQVFFSCRLIYPKLKLKNIKSKSKEKEKMSKDKSPNVFNKPWSTLGRTRQVSISW